MAMYLIGDVQGCDDALGRLLTKIGFSASRDTLFLLGDLVNRGPDSLAVLRRLMALGTSARCLLGNHDLHLLALSRGVRAPHPGDTAVDVLAATDAPALLDWLRHQPLARVQWFDRHPVLMVHAGVLPDWTLEETLARAAEVGRVLTDERMGDFIARLYGDLPDRWSEDLQGVERWRTTVNALTRLRFCDRQGRMEFVTKEGAAAAPPGFMPWFDVPGRRTAQATVAFGHWSTLGALERPDLIALDTGCVWGGCLSAVALSPSAAGQPPHRSWIQVDCSGGQESGLDRPMALTPA